MGVVAPAGGPANASDFLGSWGTHYDVRPTHQMGALGWWAAIGLAPQLSFWMGYTIGIGALFGVVAAAIARRPGTAAV